MVRYLGVVSYLGLAYKGFERQKSLPTIQGKIEEALAYLLGGKTPIHGAGRTDAGVNAKGQTFSFACEAPIADLAAFRHAFNRLLPKDIAVLSLREVGWDFDARHSCSGKRYAYSFHDGPRDPFAVAEYQLEHPGFSFSLFESAMALYQGRHDFRDFTTKPADKDAFVRDVVSVKTLDLGGGHYRALLQANGFMTYMVRIMVGVAFKVALGRMSLKEVTALLSPTERKIISYKAPAEGLCLEEVIYE